MTLKRYPNHQVRAYVDEYNFEMHNGWNLLNWLRNVQTLIGGQVAGQGMKYEIMLNKKLLYSPKVIFMYLLLLGSVLLFCSLRMSGFVDIHKQQVLNDKYLQQIFTEGACYTEHAITTYKIIVMDLGNGVITFSLFSLLFLFLFKIRTWRDFLSVKAGQRTFLFVLSNIVWFLMIPGTYFYYFYRGSRGDYTLFTDSVSIPIIQQTFFYLLLFIPLNLFLLFTLIKSKLPAKLFFRPGKYKKMSILWELFFVCSLLINLICLILFIIDGDHVSIMVSMFFAYILLSLRAGKLNYYSEKLLS